MARLRLRPVRLALCFAVGACALAAPAAAAPPERAPDAFVILEQTTSTLDATSARLAALRSRLANATPAERRRLQALERTLLARKRSLMDRRDTAAVDAVQLHQARARAGRARQARERRQEAEREAEARAQQAAAAAAAPVPLAAAPGEVVPGYNTLVGRTPGLGATPYPGLAPGGDLAAQFDSYLGSKMSPLAGLGASFVAEANAVGLDPRLLVAIAGAETSFGTYGPSQVIHNPFGLGPGRSYPSWQAAIQAAARNLAGPLYLGRGAVTIVQIQAIWAPNGAANDPTNLNSHWVRNVGRYYAELGGDPTANVFSTGASTVASPAQAGLQVQAALPGAAATPVAATAAPANGSGTGPAVAQDALALLGLPYRWGGASPVTGFDCSGLVQYLYGRRGVTLPRTAEQQAAVGIAVRPEALQPGDALFFADATGYVHHEGLYLGGGMFVHAPGSGDVVKVSSLYEEYYARQYAGARRY